MHQRGIALNEGLRLRNGENSKGPVGQFLAKLLNWGGAQGGEPSFRRATWQPYRQRHIPSSHGDSPRRPVLVPAIPLNTCDW